MSDPETPKREPAEAAGGTPATGAGSDELEQLRSERDQLRDQLQRAVADLHNIRRRHAREADEIRGRAIDALAHDLLPILDNFHLALAAHEQHSGDSARAETRSMIQGLRMVRTMLEEVLERHGLVEIEAHGQPFDPNLHEAVGVETHPEFAPGHVARVVQRGYQREGRIVRPSKVVVAQPGAGAQGDGGGAE
jgi:molecular chaperone GrpE